MVVEGGLDGGRGGAPGVGVQPIYLLHLSSASCVKIYKTQTSLPKHLLPRFQRESPSQHEKVIEQSFFLFLKKKETSDNASIMWS